MTRGHGDQSFLPTRTTGRQSPRRQDKQFGTSVHVVLKMFSQSCSIGVFWESLPSLTKIKELQTSKKIHLVQKKNGVRYKKQ